MSLDLVVKLNNLAVVSLCNQNTKEAIEALRSALSLVKEDSDKNDELEYATQQHPTAGTDYFYSSGDKAILEPSDGVFVFGRPLFLFSTEEKKTLEQHVQSWLHCGAVLLFNMALACQLQSIRFTNDLCPTEAGVLYDALIHKMDDCINVSTQLLTSMTFNNNWSIIYYEHGLQFEAQRYMHVVAAWQMPREVLHDNFDRSEISGFDLNLFFLCRNLSHAASAA